VIINDQTDGDGRHSESEYGTQMARRFGTAEGPPLYSCSIHVLRLATSEGAVLQFRLMEKSRNGTSYHGIVDQSASMWSVSAWACEFAKLAHHL
jgi:hypothetical protein